MIMEYTNDNGIYVFESKIPYREAIEDCLADRMTIFRKRSNAKANYLSLADEVVRLSNSETEENN